MQKLLTPSICGFYYKEGAKLTMAELLYLTTAPDKRDIQDNSKIIYLISQ